MAYKNIREVMAAQSDLVEPLAEFQPRIVKMAAERSAGKATRGRGSRGDDASRKGKPRRR